MSSDWPVYTVQQLVDDKILAKPKDGNHGSIHPKSTDYVDTGVPFIMATDMIENGVDFDNCKFVTEEMAAILRKGFAEPGDVLLSHKATIGRTSILQDHSYSTVVLTPQVTYYRVLNEETLNNKYLHYYFKSEGFQNLFNSWAGGGSTRAYLGITDQRKLPITVPPIGVQKGIARILGDLDQKIHLNQQTNETLEAMAQAIFKSWFVDFDPVCAKIKATSAGRDPNRAAMAAIAGISLEQDWDDIEAALDQKLSRMSEAQQQQLSRTAQLFPDELVESEIGEVPKGWEYDKLGNFITVKRGGSPRPIKDFVVPEGLHWTKISDATSESSPFIMTTKEFIKEEGLKKTVLLEKGSLILSNSATPGLPKFLNIDACIHDGWLYFPEQEHFTDLYLYHLFIEIRKALVAKGSGTVFTNLKTSILRNYDVVVPHDELIMKFTDTAQSIFASLLNNREETDTLMNLRDTLLPKLISGDVEVI